MIIDSKNEIYQKESYANLVNDLIHNDINTATRETTRYVQHEREQIQEKQENTDEKMRI